MLPNNYVNCTNERLNNLNDSFICQQNIIRHRIEKVTLGIGPQTKSSLHFG